MLLDLFEGQLDLPTAIVDIRDAQCRYREVAGHEDQTVIEFFGVELYATELFGVVLLGIEAVQHDDLIALDLCGVVHRLRTESIEVQVSSVDDD